MRCQHLADFFDGFGDSAAKPLVLKMHPHSTNDVPPELLATFFVNCFVPDDGEFVRSRRYENQHRIAFTSFVHSETLEFFLRNL